MHALKMSKIQVYLAMFLTMLQLLQFLTILVTASPIPSLTRNRNVARVKKDELNVVQYLVRYGHLEKRPDASRLILAQSFKRTDMPSIEKKKPHVLHPYTNEEITNGIKSVQNSFGLKASGKLNEETIKLIESPRCGFSDRKNNPFKVKVHHRNRRYSIQHNTAGGKKTFKWMKQTITWNILTYYKYLSPKVQDEALEKAFRLWEYVSPMMFKKSSSNTSDIRIEFAPTVHGDKYNFDGKHGILAHAFPPYGSPLAGDIHFDAAEAWNIDYNIFTVALHEIGHSLGLAHSKISQSVMYATHSEKKTELHWDDRDGINELYGACKTKVDSAIYLGGEVYLLRKDLIWKVDEFTMHNMFDERFPKKVEDEFIPAIPNDVDAALRWSDHFVYFLKGTRSWGYDRFQKYIKFDNTIAYDWPNIPNSPDASLCYIDDTISWFFKGDRCWKFNDYNLSVFPGYPKSISEVWPGLPDNINAAYYSSWAEETYFFKDTEYWVVDNKKYKQEPFIAYRGGDIHDKWKGVCSEKY